MKSRLALLAMIMVAAAPLAAQRRNGGGGGAMNADQMVKQYSLSSDQKTKTEALIKIFNDGTAATSAWMASERQAGATVNADSAKKVADARAKFNTDFKALLTADQSRLFDSVQTARGQGRRGGGK